jgi:hypothetical protein
MFCAAALGSFFPAYNADLTHFQIEKLAISREVTLVAERKCAQVTPVRGARALKLKPGGPMTRVGVPSVVSLYVSTR